MGCSASAVLLLRSVGGADCGHMCSRQDQMSLDAATPTLEGYTTTTSPLTIIVMVTNTSNSPLTLYLMHAGRGDCGMWVWSNCVHYHIIFWMCMNVYFCAFYNVIMDRCIKVSLFFFFYHVYSLSWSNSLFSASFLFLVLLRLIYDQ